jgi:hypothetical protein
MELLVPNLIRAQNLFYKHLYVSTIQICHLCSYNRRTLSQGESNLNIKQPFKMYNVHEGGQTFNQSKSE